MRVAVKCAACVMILATAVACSKPAPSPRTGRTRTYLARPVARGVLSTEPDAVNYKGVAFVYSGRVKSLPAKRKKVALLSESMRIGTTEGTITVPKGASLWWPLAPMTIEETAPGVPADYLGFESADTPFMPDLSLFVAAKDGNWLRFSPISMSNLDAEATAPLVVMSARTRSTKGLVLVGAEKTRRFPLGPGRWLAPRGWTLYRQPSGTSNADYFVAPGGNGEEPTGAVGIAPYRVLSAVVPGYPWRPGDFRSFQVAHHKVGGVIPKVRLATPSAFHRVDAPLKIGDTTATVYRFLGPRDAKTGKQVVLEVSEGGTWSDHDIEYGKLAGLSTVSETNANPTPGDGTVVSSIHGYDEHYAQTVSWRIAYEAPPTLFKQYLPVYERAKKSFRVLR